MAERGYGGAKLRDVAARTGVSVGLLYRYFPNKRAVVLQIYEELSADYFAAAAAMPRGKWRVRFLFALKTSLRVLQPHRHLLAALLPVLVADPGEGLFSPATAFSRVRVEQVFHDAVEEAEDAPSREDAAALGRLLYLVQLVVILFWLLDKSRDQQATEGLIALVERLLPRAVDAYRLRPIRALVRSGDALFREAMLEV
jgi:AcrR family transcriptional regulator